MINAESYQQLMDALNKVFESLQGGSDSSGEPSSKGPSDKAITIVSIGKARPEEKGMIPKAKKGVKQPKKDKEQVNV